MKLRSKTIETPDYNQVFRDNKFSLGRMISGSKIGYLSEHRGNVVLFNANIATKKSGKIWYGDIDITISRKTLENIAKTLNEDLYIVRELDGRFDKEKNGINYWKSVAVEIIKK